jgi:hypothetical protein
MSQSRNLPCVFTLLLLASSLPAWASSVDNFSDVKFSKGFDTKLAWSFTSGGINEKVPDFSRSFGGKPLFERGRPTNGRIGGHSVSEESFSGTRFLDKSDRHPSGEDRGHHDGCERGDDCQKVPEGGAPVSYVILSGLAVIAGILISGKHRAARTIQSS